MWHQGAEPATVNNVRATVMDVNSLSMEACVRNVSQATTCWKLPRCVRPAPQTVARVRTSPNASLVILDSTCKMVHVLNVQAVYQSVTAAQVHLSVTTARQEDTGMAAPVTRAWITVQHAVRRTLAPPAVMATS